MKDEARLTADQCSASGLFVQFSFQIQRNPDLLSYPQFISIWGFLQISFSN